MIHLRKLTLRRGTKILLDKADISFFDKQKIGIVGANGVGKTSLYQCILGNLPPDEGELDIPSKLSVAHLQQDTPSVEDNAVDYALLGDREYADTKAAMEEAEDSDDGMAIAHAVARFAEIDGYTAHSRAAKILNGLGFAQCELNDPVKSFSGGWRMRLNLAQVLLSRADILLLDEPTNHLDLEGILWLGEWIKKADCMVVVISHDREFLDDITTHIAHFKNHALKMYTGNYSTFEKEYAMQLAIQHASHSKQQAKRAHLQKFIDRFGAKATKARQAQSRVKMLERMELVAPVHQENPFSFAFANNVAGANPMLTMKHVDVGYDDTAILSDINLSFRDEDRIGLLGLNGEGKSTLIKLIAGKLSCMRGSIESSNKIKIGYFAQHQLEYLDLNENMLTHLKRIDASVTESQARNFFGGFNFSGDRVFEKTASFSGGEKARVALALLVWQKPNLLLLDEPTNHLDMEMREALVQALQSYEGALVLVSHDRYLLKCIVDEFWLVDSSKVTQFDGDVDDYRRWFKEREKEETPVTSKKSKAKSNVDHSRDIEKLESKLVKQEKRLTELESQLNEADLYQQNNHAQLKKLQDEHRQLTEKILAVEEDILKLLDD